MTTLHSLAITTILVASATLIAPGQVRTAFSDDVRPRRDPGIIAGPMIVQIGADDLTLIHAPSGGGIRVLLSFSGLAELAGTTVHSAQLEIPGLHFDDPTALEAFLLETPWEPGAVDWDSPWQRPGGDLDLLRGSYARIGPDDGTGRPVRFNVSPAVRAIVNEERTNAGFILVPSRHVIEGTPASGLSEALATDLESLTGIQLVVFCVVPEGT